MMIFFHHHHQYHHCHTRRTNLQCYKRCCWLSTDAAAALSFIIAVLTMMMMMMTLMTTDHDCNYYYPILRVEAYLIVVPTTITSRILLSPLQPPPQQHRRRHQRHFLVDTLKRGFRTDSKVSALTNDDDDDDRIDNVQQKRTGTESKKTTNQKRRATTQPLTAGDVRRELLRNPAPFFDAVAAQNSQQRKKTASRRTRKRVDQPQQQYVYASQRTKLVKRNVVGADNGNTIDDDNNEHNTNGTNGKDPMATTSTTTAPSKNVDLILAKEYGLLPSMQHCDAVSSSGDHPDDDNVPSIVASLRVSTNHNDNDNNDDTSTSTTTTTTSTNEMAYIIYKPAGWSILGGKINTNSNVTTTTTTMESNDDSDVAISTTKPQHHDTDRTRRRITANDGSFVVEYAEMDVWACLTREELCEAHDRGELDDETFTRVIQSLWPTPASATTTVPSSIDSKTAAVSSSPSMEDHDDTTRHMDPQTLANLRRIQARSLSSSSPLPPLETASSSVSASSRPRSGAGPSRPSIISWLKETKAALGTPIRGGNYWTALAGAVDVDDTGLVLLCPKTNVDNVCVEYVEYMAVVGNGNRLDPTSGKSKLDKKYQSQEPPIVESLAKLRRGRGDDIVETVKITIPEIPSTCSNVIRICQERYQDGIRGDPASSPFDRRAPRRLIHCHAMSISSQTFDDTVEIETDGLPDDIAVLSERRNHLEYKNGSFLGRSVLQKNPSTTAYREINGAADGFPGWTVDRYGPYLLVYHDTKYPKGPLPSIHDGKTIGVYYLESNPNRSSMGSETDARPRLLEGRPAPDIFPILENGVTYLVSLHRDLSTGIFLDQRLHRAWLHRNCNPTTKVLNCFAHTGAFSVAAASAGASTVSLDLSKKWLDRLPDQLLANGVEFDERHDCIYGDCFDWLARLAKRKELYDIVILDPPSTSIGQKRKRWSIQDMDELVELAVPLVKKGGFLWTTTNSGSMPITKFVRLCRKGLVDAGVPNAKLERIQPMPTDFPSVGPQPVKNLVWRIL